MANRGCLDPAHRELHLLNHYFSKNICLVFRNVQKYLMFPFPEATVFRSSERQPMWIMHWLNQTPDWCQKANLAWMKTRLKTSRRDHRERLTITNPWTLPPGVEGPGSSWPSVPDHDSPQPHREGDSRPVSCLTLWLYFLFQSPSNGQESPSSERS